MYSFAYNLMRLPSTLLICGLILWSAALAGCTTTAPRTPPMPAPVAQGDNQPEPPTPGIKPLTVEQEEQFGG